MNKFEGELKMEQNFFEYVIKVNDNISIRFIENENVSNIFINDNEKNLITKSAHDITFAGLLSMIAFYTKTDNYTFSNEGVVLYREVISFETNLYLQLEESLEYYDEEIDDISLDYDAGYELSLNYRVNDKETEDLLISSYLLDENVYELFQEINDFISNKDYYLSKILARTDIEGDNLYTDHVVRK
ncbi:MAG: hypothetical protein K0Q49_939 [Haloplasmataceae bacterium]|jgi:hypothetical protein|nr:hypothetical protein [Haloplasmataceae bacterium]